MSDALLRDMLIRHEGLRLKPYRDTVGKLTIGVGRNLDDVGVSRDEALALLDGDIARARAGLDAHLPWWRALDAARAAALTDMAFNLGVEGLLGFHDTLFALQAGRWRAASQAMLASRWAAQVGARATELAGLIAEGLITEGLIAEGAP